jgi:glycyl-tRNA synthetase
LEQQGKIEVDVEGVGSGKVELDKELVTIEKRTRVENVREYTPNVIEPSFGIGRIFYSMMEHVYWSREGDEARGVCICPFQYDMVSPANFLRYRSCHSPLQLRLPRFLLSLSRAMPLSVLCHTVKDNTFTLRDRDSTKQVRAGEDEILQALKSLVDGDETWEDVRKRLPEFTGQEVD